MATIQKITLSAQDDKIDHITLYYNNKSKLIYLFSATKTGEKPDDEIFN